MTPVRLALALLASAALAAPARTEVDLAPIEGQVANLATAATQRQIDSALKQLL